MTRKDFNEALTTIATARAQEAYAEALTLWRDLEGKARGNITLAGVFLAGAFGFAKDSADSANVLERCILIAAVLSLASTILTAFTSLKTQTVKSPPSGDQVDRMVREVLDGTSETETEEVLASFRLDIARGWNGATAQLDEVNDRKVSWIWWSQLFMVAAAALVTAAVVARLL
jgi:hypothetical protein